MIVKGSLTRNQSCEGSRTFYRDSIGVVNPPPPLFPPSPLSTPPAYSSAYSSAPVPPVDLSATTCRPSSGVDASNPLSRAAGSQVRRERTKENKGGEEGRGGGETKIKIMEEISVRVKLSLSLSRWLNSAGGQEGGSRFDAWSFSACTV